MDTSTRQPTNTAISIIEEIQNLTLENVMPFFYGNILSAHGLMKMNKDPYIVYGIPTGSKTASLYIDSSGFLHMFNGEITISSSQPSSSLRGTLIFGTFNARRKTFYPLDIAYFNRRDVSNLKYYSPQNNKDTRLSLLLSRSGKSKIPQRLKLIETIKDGN